MTEKKSVVTGREIKYEGIFSVSELVSTVKEFMSKRGYSYKIGMNVETVKPHGKFIKIEATFKRTINEYCTYEVGLEYIFENIKEVEVVREGTKLRMNKGKAMISINSYVMTDYEGYWEKSPITYVMRHLMQKFILGDPHKRWMDDVKKDVGDVVAEINAFFNLQKLDR